MGKTYFANSVSMQQILEFEVVFPEEERKPFDFYLKGSSREKILLAASFFLGFKSHDSKYKDNKEFVSMFFRKENETLANRINKVILGFEQTGTSIGIINAYSSLKLFEYIFSTQIGEIPQTSAEFEVNLFKAYLALNSEFCERQAAGRASLDDCEKELYIPMMVFCMQYPLNDKVNYDLDQIWITQMIKSIYLFQFLETNSISQALLNAFLKDFNCQNWQVYLKKLLPLTMAVIKNEKEAHTDITVPNGPAFHENCHFIEKLMVEDIDVEDKDDFLSLRAKPFYKVSPGVYRIIFPLFVVEKIFKGIYFQLRDINKTLPKLERIKSIKGFYGYEFSEKFLAYKAIDAIYPDNCLKLPGEQLDNMGIIGAPDYYLRKSKNILVFESKDFLIAAEPKMSFNYNVYDEKLGRILDYEESEDGKIKNGAVLQLINSIRMILKKEFPADKNYHYKDVFIYPILLTHDHQYNTPGFNELIDFWFQEELLTLKAEGLFINHVKPLAVVCIDSLIYHQKRLLQNVALHLVLDEYFRNKILDKPQKKKIQSDQEAAMYFEKIKDMRISKLIPFSLFIDKLFKKMGLNENPPLLELVAPVLFKGEFVGNNDKSIEGL